MKNLTILIYSLAGGGAERVVSILVNELKEKYNITLVLMNSTVFYDISEDINIVYLENSMPSESGLFKLLKLPFLAFKYKNICAELNTDISLSFLNRPNYINTFSKTFGNKSKILISERIAPSQEYNTNSMKDKISRFLISYLYPKANLIIPNAKMIAYELINHFKIDKNKIKVINNPINIDKIELLKNDMIKIDMSKFTFITIGRLQNQKNHKLMIKAFSKIKDFNTQLLIIGDGELKANLINLVESLKLTNRVIFLGREENPYKFLVKANCFVFSSNYEGFPNVLLEALACNLPIISTDCISGPREILSPKSDISKKLNSNIEFTDHGILVPINNEDLLSKAMLSILKNKNGRYTNNYIYAKSYSKDKIIKEFINEL